MSEASASGRVVGVVPARWGSTRFPGKSLALVAGRPMIHWVVERVRRARRLSGVVVATDDARIAESVRSLGYDDVDVATTRADHPSGTDRVAEAIRALDVDAVVNVQGDEPLVDPALIDELAGFILGDEWDMATAAAPIENLSQLADPSVVKVVFGYDGRALYFSRAAIPHVRDAPESAPDGAHWRHIGIYAYRRDYLLRLVAEPPGKLERLEKLEQLRALQLGCRMKVLQTADFGIGVDTPDDVARVEALGRAAGVWA